MSEQNTSSARSAMENIPLAPTRRMPKPGEKNAPTFDAEKPEELSRFFERIEEWYAEEKITDDDEKKRRIVRYIEPESEAQWKALAKYRKGTYAEFKAQVMSSYPEAEDILKGSMVTLKRKIKSFGSIDVEDRQELHNLVRTMTAEVAKLEEIRPPIHTNRELVELFLARLTPEFASRVANKLTMERQRSRRSEGQENPETEKRNSEDMFDISEVMEFAKETAEEAKSPYARFTTTKTSGSSANTIKLEEAVARLTDSLNLQMQHNKNMEQRFAALQNSLSNKKDTQEYPMRHEYPVRSYDQSGCFYCKGNHRITECESARIHLDLKWIKKVENHLRLPDGSKIPRDGAKSMKEVVETISKSRPGIIPVNKIQNKAVMMQGGTQSFSRNPNAVNDEEVSNVLSSLIQKVGLERLQSLIQTQDIEEDEPEWDQNFD